MFTFRFLPVQHNSSRKSSEIQREMEAEEQSRQLLQSELEEKLEERKRSMELSSTENGLQLMERRQFRQFSRADEYLYAMKEDLAEWMNNLYPHIDMDADNFMTRLETGENLVQVRQEYFFFYTKVGIWILGLLRPVWGLFYGNF